MTELEEKLRAAMRSAVDHEQPPGDLTAVVIRRHRRRTAMLASLSVAASVAVAIAVAAALPSRGSAPIGPPPGSSPLRPGHPTSELHGAAMPPGSNVRLLFDGVDQLAWYSTATRRLVPITGFPAGTEPDITTRVQGGYVAGLIYMGVSPCTPRCGAPSEPAYYIADGAKVATRIGGGWLTAPSSIAGAVWLTNYPHSARQTSVGRAQQVGPDGRLIGRPVTLPGYYTIFAGVGKYLLLTDYSQATPAMLWDPASRRVVRNLGQVDVAGPEQIAWGRTCDGCPLHVLDVRTGRNWSIAIPRGSRVDIGGNSVGAFSTDGTLLAVELSTGIDGHGAAHAVRLGVIDLATGRLLTVPGVDLSPRAAGFFFSFGWQSGTRRLVATLARPGHGYTIQVGYWQPGAARLRVTTARIPRDTIHVFVQ